jgi:putative N6-adenine-specific DNA methylase
MQETLAAAVIQATGWKGKGNFINPMCGSGTLAIEAAMVALERAAGLLRKNYGFMHLKGFSLSSWQEILREAKGRAKKSFDGKIVATDIDSKAIRESRQNAAAAGVDSSIEFARCDFSETSIPDEGGVVVLNPEYGERLGKIEELREIYKGIGDFFKKRCQGYTGYIFTGNLDLAKKVGLKARRRLVFFNSNIECRLLEYDLYEGTRRSGFYR